MVTPPLEHGELVGSAFLATNAKDERMALFLYLIAAFDRYIVGEFGSSGTSPEPLFQAGFWAAVFLTVRGVRSRPTATNLGDRSIWNSVEYYSFLFSNVAVLLVALIFNPPWEWRALRPPFYSLCITGRASEATGPPGLTRTFMIELEGRRHGPRRFCEGMEVVDMKGGDYRVE